MSIFKKTSEMETIVSTKHLNNKQFSDVYTLIDKCRNFYLTEEACFAENDANYLTDFPCFFLTYVGSSLVAFISIFVPDKDNCEIYSLTDPEYVDNDRFSLRLVNSIRVAKVEGCKHIQFVNDTKDTFNSINLKKLDYTVESSTCLLTLDLTSLREKKNYRFDKETYVLDIKHDSADSLNTSIDFLIDNKRIGFCSLEVYMETACIHHLEIVSSYRGKGYGSRLMDDLLRYICEVLPSISHVILNVEQQNQVALTLYTHYGFECSEQLDYYRL